MKAWRHRDRQLHLIFSSGRFDHGTRLLDQLNVFLDSKQLLGIFTVAEEVLQGCYARFWFHARTGQKKQALQKAWWGMKLGRSRETQYRDRIELSSAFVVAVPNATSAVGKTLNGSFVALSAIALAKMFLCLLKELSDSCL